jgi:hypothetical protein
VSNGRATVATACVAERVADGVAVDRPGMRVVLKFHLED